jgi:hypothetical protein
MNRLLTWLVVSSANPNAFSLTFKGIMLQYVAVIIIVLRYFDVPTTETEIVEYVGIIASVLGTVMGLVGLLRKLYMEIKAIVTKFRS